MNIPRKPLFWSVGLGHTLNDTFMSMGPTVLTFLSASIMPISAAQIGAADSLRQLTGAVSQPLFGWLADKTGGRLLGAGGVVWTVTVMAMAMLVAVTTGNYWLMLIPYALSAVGSGAFHPVGTLHAAASDRTRATSSLSWFFLLGQLGLGLGPSIAGALISAFNSITPLFFLSILVLPLALFMAGTLPTQQAYAVTKAEAKKKKSATTTPIVFPVKPFLLLTLIVSLRSMAQPGSGTFIPLLFEQKGWEPAQYGLIAGAFWISSGIIGVICGNLADRFDRRYVMAVTLLACVPMYFLLPTVEGVGVVPLVSALVLAIAAGGLSGGSHSIIVAMAQEMIPGAEGFASGAIMGLIFGTGAVGSFLIGVISESIGLPPTFQIIGAVMIPAAVLSLFLPRRALPVAATPIETVSATVGD